MSPSIYWRANRKSSAFTLAELALAMFLALLASGALLTAFKLSADSMYMLLDRRASANRTARAVAFLKSPVFYCGSGLPSDAASYRAAFGNSAYAPYSWNGPIEVRNAPNSYPDGLLMLAYAQPSGIALAGRAISVGGSVNAELSSTPDVDMLAASAGGGSVNIKSWIVFPETMPPSVPLRVMSLSGRRLALRSAAGREFYIQKGAEFSLFRAYRIFCDNGVLYSVDYRTTGTQPRIEGIMDIRFGLDMAERLLTVYVLSRGNHVYKSPREINGAGSWPEEYLAPWRAAQPVNYQLYASKVVWRLPNCIRENILDGTGVAEAY